MEPRLEVIEEKPALKECAIDEAQKQIDPELPEELQFEEPRITQNFFNSDGPRTII